MSKVKPNLLFASLSGRVLGSKTQTSIRTLYGKEHTYTYVHKPSEWSDAQVLTRQMFGVSSYYARLICHIPEARDYFTALFHKQKKYHRLDNFVASHVAAVMKADEGFRTMAGAAHQEHMTLRNRHAEHEAALIRQTAEAKTVWESKFKTA